MLMASAMLLGSCSEWTEPESLDLSTPAFGSEDPEAYAAYLSNLRSWKTTDHAVVLGLFDNSVSEPTTRAHHVSSLPDSLDFVILGTPALVSWQQEEMHDVQTRKGTRFLYEIDCRTIEQSWDALQDSADESISEGVVPGDFATYAAGILERSLALCGTYGYDGVLLWYSGRSTLHMTDEELAEYTARQQALLEPVESWLSETAGAKSLLFGGDPTTLLDKSLLLQAEYIVVETSEATSVDELTYAVTSCMGTGIPTGNFVVTVSTAVDSDTDPIGYYGSQMALPLAAEWVTRPSSTFTRAGLLIRDIQRDFYNASLIYKHAREAIDTINPSPKN